MRRFRFWFELGALGTGLVAALGILELVLGRVATGVALIALAALAWLARRGRGSLPKPADGTVESRAPLHAYIFFGACTVVGTALLVLALLGTTRDPGLYGPIGAVLAACGAYVILARRRT